MFCHSRFPLLVKRRRTPTTKELSHVTSHNASINLAMQLHTLSLQLHNFPLQLQHRSCGDIKLDLCLVHRCRYLVTSADTQGASNPEFKKDLFAAGLFFCLGALPTSQI